MMEQWRNGVILLLGRAPSVPAGSGYPLVRFIRLTANCRVPLLSLTRECDGEMG